MCLSLKVAGGTVRGSKNLMRPVDDRRLAVKVVRSNGTDEVLARATNLLIARGAYREAAGMYPDELIQLRQGARVVERSE
jgi:hypothetical protein